MRENLLLAVLLGGIGTILVSLFTEVNLLMAFALFTGTGYFQVATRRR